MVILSGIQTLQPSEQPTVLLLVFKCVLYGIFAVLILRRLCRLIERRYALRYQKPIFRSVIGVKRKLHSSQIVWLQDEFEFYTKLDKNNQLIFQHRLATFMQHKAFVGREDLDVTLKMKTLISATAVMLTFGFRAYLIHLFDTIIIYPKRYYSTVNGVYHKGETNLKLGTVVLSWEDFEYGYQIGNDNLNLGIHEFGHAIHLNALHSNDISSFIFKEGFKALTAYLQAQPKVRADLIASTYFRAYAYTNHYEFYAVLLETYIETPVQFKSQFPILYKHMQTMLNFNFTDYK